MAAVAIESGFLPIGGSILISWTPTDAGNGSASITGASIPYKLFTAAEWDVEKAAAGTGTATLTGSLTESPSGTYTATLAVPTTLTDGAAYVLFFELTATGLTADRFGECLARYPNSAGG